MQFWPVVLLAGIIAVLFAAWLARDVISQDRGTKAMQEVAGLIFEGAMAFLNRQYRTISVFAVVAAVSRQGHEGFANNIGHDQRGATGLAVDECGRDGPAKFVLGGHVHDGVVNENRIEKPPEPQVSHVAGKMLALGIERAAEVEHSFRQIYQCRLKMRFEVRRVVAASGAKLEQRARWRRTRLDQELASEFRLFGIVRRGREQVKP